MKTVIIIGAGPAGLTAAYELLKHPGEYRVVVLEASDCIGGISKTVTHNGNRMDMGGHRFFSKVPEVNEWWQQLLPMQGKPSQDDLLLDREVPVVSGEPDPELHDRVMLVRTRVSRILFDNKFYDYPSVVNHRFRIVASVFPVPIGYPTTHHTQIQIGRDPSKGCGRDRIDNPIHFPQLCLSREKVLNHLVLRHILLVTGYILRHQQHVISVMEQHLRVESSEKMKIARKQLEAEVIMLRKDLEVQQRQNENIEKFIQKAHKYVGIEELDPSALRELVKAIYVDAPVKVNGKCTQYIHIQYDGIGFIPLDELLKGETA